MRAMEEEGTVSYLSIIFGATSFSDLLSRIDFVREIMEYDNNLEAEYIAAREHVAEVKAEYEATQAEQEETRAELEDKKAELEANIAAACQVISDLESDITAYEAYYAEKEAAEAELDEEITEMLQELEKQEEEAKAAGQTVVVGTGAYTWPLPGYSAGSRTFGYQLHPILNVMKYHSGQDIGAPLGTPIYAADSGTVALANTTNSWGGGYGYYVTIDHGEGRATLYAHMSSVAVSTGDVVSQGQLIGYVGSTGMSTGPHLHFETRVNGTAVDPMQYFS
jgi:murein DD-endopeptidase MepM/ murein hydrolase activator NlpD